MTQIEIYTKNWCPYCARAKAELGKRGVGFTEIDITNDPRREREMIKRAKRTTVPQIFIGDHHIGGSDDLADLLASDHYSRLQLALQIPGASRSAARDTLSQREPDTA